MPGAACLLVSDKKNYKPDDNIQLQISIYKKSVDTEKLIVHKDFFKKPYHQLLTIIGPDGRPIPRKQAVIAKEPAPAYSYKGSLLVPVELAIFKSPKIWLIPDARKYYGFEGKFGWYTAYLRTSLETFSGYKELDSGIMMADLLDKDRQIYDAVASNRIRFEIAPTNQMYSPIVVYVASSNFNNMRRLKGIAPNKIKTAVYVYRRSQIPKDLLPLNSKTSGPIWNSVRPVKSTLTDSKGAANFSKLIRDDYLILARAKSDPASDFLAGFVASSDKGWETSKPISLKLEKIR